MKVAILASVWCQNLWDELILKNEISLFEEGYSEEKIKFKVFSYDVNNPFFERENVEYLEYFPINSKKLSNLWKNIKNLYLFIKTIFLTNVVVIWWWGLFYDNEIQSVWNPLKIWLFRARLAKLFRKKLVFYWVSINIKNDVNLPFIKSIFSLWDEVYVRDEFSSDILRWLKIKCKVVLDSVFYDDKDNSNLIKKSFCLKKLECKKFKVSNLKNIDFSDKKVGISFRRGYLNHKYADKQNTKMKEKLEVWRLVEIINFVSLAWAKKITLLPHSFHKVDKLANDYDFCINLKEELEKNWKRSLLKKIKICYDMKQTYKIYKNNKIDICLSQRLHSMILSQAYKIPFVWFSYSSKTDELLKKL